MQRARCDSASPREWRYPRLDISDHQLESLQINARDSLRNESVTTRLDQWALSWNVSIARGACNSRWMHWDYLVGTGSGDNVQMGFGTCLDFEATAGRRSFYFAKCECVFRNPQSKRSAPLPPEGNGQTPWNK